MYPVQSAYPCSTMRRALCILLYIFSPACNIRTGSIQAASPSLQYHCSRSRGHTTARHLSPHQLYVGTFPVRELTVPSLDGFFLLYHTSPSSLLPCPAELFRHLRLTRTAYGKRLLVHSATCLVSPPVSPLSRLLRAGLMSLLKGAPLQIASMW